MSRVKCGFDDGAEVPAARLLVRIGPTLKVDLGVDPDYDAARPQQRPTPTIRAVAALIDTGASLSCIDAGLAMDLELPIIDQVEVAGVGGLHRFNLHLAQIHAPDLKFTLYGEFAGVDLAASGQHTALIGRDFLNHFHLSYEGPSGSVTLVDPRAPAEITPWPDE